LEAAAGVVLITQLQELLVLILCLVLLLARGVAEVQIMQVYLLLALQMEVLAVEALLHQRQQEMVILQINLHLKAVMVVQAHLLTLLTQVLVAVVAQALLVEMEPKLILRGVLRRVMVAQDHHQIFLAPQ